MGVISRLIMEKSAQTHFGTGISFWPGQNDTISPIRRAAGDVVKRSRLRGENGINFNSPASFGHVQQKICRIGQLSD